ncbi:MAG: threonine aldolase family protein [Chromatiales bacterium]|nr:threonine aldolase family protein [Chromatiales bacterium]
MSQPRINLYSDTQTRPSAAMRRAMAEAPVGDEQRGEDPTVNRLCELVAALLGKEAAVFLPSGTMCNEIAILVHCRGGDEIIADRSAHILNFEGGAPGALTGAQIHGLDGQLGMFTADQVRAALRDPANRYAPRSRLLVVEQTANLAGGTVWSVERMQEVAAVARGAGLAVHMDGARLMNAVVASGRAAAEHAAPFDSVWTDLSKGLGAPVGAVLAGSAEFIGEAWRWKQRLGGAMRQAGIIAAAGVYAFEHNVERLAEDHANARRFAELVVEIPGLVVDMATVQTNMVYIDVTGTGASAAEINRRLEARGIRISAIGPSTLRAVTHLDVDRAMVEEAAAALAAVTRDIP